MVTARALNSCSWWSSPRLATALHRPAILPAPAWALQLALGEMSVLLLGGQRLQPRRALEAGFVFRYPELGAALAQVV